MEGKIDLNQSVIYILKVYTYSKFNIITIL